MVLVDWVQDVVQDVVALDTSENSTLGLSILGAEKWYVHTADHDSELGDGYDWLRVIIPINWPRVRGAGSESSMFRLPITVALRS